MCKGVSTLYSRCSLRNTQGDTDYFCAYGFSYCRIHITVTIRRNETSFTTGRRCSPPQDIDLVVTQLHPKQDL